MPSCVQSNMEDEVDNEMDNFQITSWAVKQSKKITWELKGFQEIMNEGIQKAFSLDFTFDKIQDKKELVPNSSDSVWRIQLDSVQDEPALSLLLLSSTQANRAQVYFYKFRATVVKSKTEEDAPAIISYPNENYFYEAVSWKNRETVRKFGLHRQLDFGSSYVKWLPICLHKDGTVKFEIEIEIAHANNSQTIVIN